ncbi:serine hydrolase domain-containing protein [Roseiterribacter gracilis]|uniref:Beta-lactamase-related domain-containing protein n=1 Tax=Roseiterribacter gracilis TaxID=2812848 RepID=A0A8S8X6X3_9PROT|nr:hypothetical protein TMPK1_13650 [Rhodospirillales bacterium TMPK1]
MPTRLKLAVLLVLLFTAQAQAAVDPALREARQRLFEPALNAVTFRQLDAFFPTALVGVAADARDLPRAERKLDFRYQRDAVQVDLDAFLARSFTNGLLVLKDGKIVTELYRNGSNQFSRFAAFSVSKSVVSTLIGIAVDEGAIASLDDAVDKYATELRGTAYQGVTIRNALRMMSGVGFDESYKFGSDAQLARAYDGALVRNEIRFTDFARELKPTHRQGEAFNYSTLETSVLGLVLERATRTDLATYTETRLWRPAGMESSAYWLLDGAAGTGRAFAGAGLNATLRDLGRFGQMILDGGMANGKQVVSSSYVTRATEPEGPEPARPNGTMGYQYQWWTLPNSDDFTAKGVNGQFVYIAPREHIVIVKTSHWPVAWDRGLEAETLAGFRAMIAELSK